MKSKKVAFMTLGCKVNMYDTEAMRENFQKKGYDIVDFDEYSDIYIINTCTVTNFGDKKSRQSIRKAKRQNPDSIVVATGCYSQVFPQEVENIDGINIVMGTKDRKNIVEIVEKYSDKTKIFNNVSDIMKEHEFEKLSVNNLKGRTRAFLKIQEGCNKFCSYCIIPYARGPVRSRKVEDVLSEVQLLAENGFKEVVLTGIHVASYGIDLNNMNLIKIIKLVHEINGIERIRFSSIEPNVVTDEFVYEMGNLYKICDHFHLSLQSGCNKTLERMNRKYNISQYKNAVEKLRITFKDVAITTDVIVGFPGETEKDFIESCNFAKEINLSKIHVFPFSPKKGTKAYEFKEQVPNEIKNQRSKKMIEISNNLNKEFLSKFIGKNKNVLFERNTEKNIYEGHTTNYITVNSDCDKNITNNVLTVKIEEIIKNETVIGKVIF